eukprot:491995-Amphidinium_carterae.1
MRSCYDQLQPCWLLHHPACPQQVLLQPAATATFDNPFLRKADQYHSDGVPSCNSFPQKTLSNHSKTTKKRHKASEQLKQTIHGTSDSVTLEPPRIVQDPLWAIWNRA